MGYRVCSVSGVCICIWEGTAQRLPSLYLYLYLYLYV
jgi:hypothetical protein